MKRKWAYRETRPARNPTQGEAARPHQHLCKANPFDQSVEECKLGGASIRVRPSAAAAAGGTAAGRAGDVAGVGGAASGDGAPCDPEPEPAPEPEAAPAEEAAAAGWPLAAAVPGRSGRTRNSAKRRSDNSGRQSSRSNRGRKFENTNLLVVRQRGTPRFRPAESRRPRCLANTTTHTAQLCISIN